LTRLAQVLLNEPQNLYPGDLQLLGKLLAQSRLIGKKRGPKSAPIETRTILAAEMYRAITKRGPQIKALVAHGRIVAFAADLPSLSGITAATLPDREARIKAVADFGNVTVEQLERHLKHGPHKPAKRKPAKR
jgi:hypothetical protein